MALRRFLASLVRVDSGGLNKYLIYPTSFNLNKLFTHLAHSFFYFSQILFFIFLFTFYNRAFVFEIISMQKIIMFFLAITIASITYFYMNAICEYTAFWAENIWSLGVMLQMCSRFLGGGLIPLAFFPETFQIFIQYTPFPYLVNFPIQILISDIPLDIFFQKLSFSFLWVLVFSFLSNIVWEKGRYQYSGAGM